MGSGFAKLAKSGRLIPPDGGAGFFQQPVKARPGQVPEMPIRIFASRHGEGVSASGIGAAPSWFYQGVSGCGRIRANRKGYGCSGDCKGFLWPGPGWLGPAAFVPQTGLFLACALTPGPPIRLARKQDTCSVALRFCWKENPCRRAIRMFRTFRIFFLSFWAQFLPQGE